MGTFLHRLDPRTKLLLTALFTTLVFLMDTLPVVAVQAVFFTALCLAGGIPLKKVFPHCKMLLALIALVIVLHLFFGRGLSAGLMIGCRIIALVTLMPMLTMTTDPQLLAFGITQLGVPYRAAHVITAALNMIPSFEEEARVIMDARRLRGMQAVRFRAYPAIVLPLMFKAMRQAQMAALAMDSRAFGAYRTRTFIRKTKFSALDWRAFAAGIVWSGIVVPANYFFGKAVLCPT
ncbi:MAG: energy-coupling factor transporter transmembrane protein EcfT [Treponema sp.]|nr:energy-coupling factor transporter transmembrane protein EcfT [Treponema sp.]